MAPRRETIYRGRYALLDGVVEEDVAFAVDGQEITEILRGDDADRQVDAGRRVVDLGDVAILPGQINVHSHAFQRALRGKTEYRSGDGGDDDFWSWRVEMYDLARQVEPAQMEIIAKMAFLEMLRAGITHVGEFHYLQHRRGGKTYDVPGEMARRIARAAKAVGIRLTLMPVAYHTGGIGQAPSPDQRRFVSVDVATYLQRAQQFADWSADEDLVRVGLAPHSIRAVPQEWFEEIADRAAQRGWPVHIHVCEQRREVRESEEAYGVPPIEALHQWGVLDASWTLIHGTHLSDRELEILEELRPTVGACPTTERNLGDGFLPASELVARRVPIALGSDSHTVIDPFEEMRLVEYHERLRREERNVLVGVDPDRRRSTAEILFPMGTTAGARSLRCPGGRLEVGAPADFVAVDLGHPSLAGATAQSLLSDVVLSMSAAAVRDVIVGGQALVAEGVHHGEDEVVSDYRQLMKELAQRRGSDE